MTRAHRLPQRDPERGAVAIIIAALWLALFGMAALAVDIGYRYQSQRNLQAVADASVMYGMRSLQTSSSTAITNATKMATKNGYTSGVTVSTPTSRQLEVVIQANQPSFFGSIFKPGARSLTVTSIGQLGPSPVAIYAADPSCSPTSAAPGLALNGGPATITGDIGSAGVIAFGGGNGALNGNANALCALPAMGSMTVSGSLGTSATSSPFSYTFASFTCTTGTTSTPGTLNLSGSLSGVYCSGGDIEVSADNITATATFVAAGHIGFSITSATITAAENGIIAYTTNNGACTGINAINVGSATVNFSGSLYAPLGCINVNAPDVTIDGSLSGMDVQLEGANMTIDSSGGASTTYQLYQ